ncbi:hypothetical protein Cni_G27507 [Canna indica]|uniref:Uncharacterized protein n=1 Tax=Canna indica TaxID=4628 RepID=A0AAQ3L1V0_9LILI|nr:hypothetical protein Cni_G27507 [Canna indica]
MEADHGIQQRFLAAFWAEIGPAQVKQQLEKMSTPHIHYKNTNMGTKEAVPISLRFLLLGLALLGLHEAEAGAAWALEQELHGWLQLADAPENEFQQM